jgi:hypothetical protein
MLRSGSKLPRVGATREGTIHVECNVVMNAFGKYLRRWVNYRCCTVKFRSFIHSSVALQPFVGPWPLLQFRNHFSQPVGLLGRVVNQSQGRYLHVGQQDRINTYTDIHVLSGIRSHDPSVRAKTVHALDRAATVIGVHLNYGFKFQNYFCSLWQVGTSRRRLDNNNKINVREEGGGGMDWIHMAQDTDQGWALLNMAISLRVP